METAIAMGVFGVVFSILGWLLANKDKKQAEEIDKLFALVKEENEKRSALQLYIAGKHYERHELDSKFDKLDTSIKEGFNGLRADMKEMMVDFRSHLNTDHRGGQ